MKILYVIDSLGTGGAERSTADLWYYLRDNNIEVDIVALRKRTEGIQQEIMDANFNVTFLTPANIISQVYQLVKIIKNKKPIIVHAVLFSSNLRTRLARFIVKFRYVESLVNCPYDKIRLKDPRISWFSFYYYKTIDWLTIFKIDRFIAITNTVKSHYCYELSIHPDKISVIYRGRNKNKYLSDRVKLRESLLKELKLDNDFLLITHVGRQEYQKGHLVLLRAIEKLKIKEGVMIAFIFVGRSGNSSPDIKLFLNNHQLKYSDFWLGHRYDVEQILTASDIFVFPSLYEGLGGALIEAQAAGLPIICSDIPVFHEVVEENSNAELFQISNDEELATKLKKMILDKDLRQRLSARSLQNFSKKFVLEKVNQKILNLYKDLV